MGSGKNVQGGDEWEGGGKNNATDQRSEDLSL